MSKCCINVFDDGPLGVEELEKLTGINDEQIQIKSRIALCRCGASENKPFCDGAHKKIGFESKLNKSENDQAGDDGDKSIKVYANGPYEVSGDVQLNIDDEMNLSGDNPYYLCRCGASENKPFCDGSHKNINFTDE